MTRLEKKRSASVEKLRRDRQSILAAMGEITTLRQGSLTEQYVTRADRSTGSRQANGHRRKHGPYYVHTWYTNGKKHTEHIPTDEAPQMQSLIQNYQKMKALFDDLLDITEQMTLKK